MKALEIMNYDGKMFAVLVETKPKDDTKGYLSYFIDGNEITNFSRLVKRYQVMFTALSDTICDGLDLQKFSY